jgi:protease PrsW
MLATPTEVKSDPPTFTHPPESRPARPGRALRVIAWTILSLGISAWLLLALRLLLVNPAAAGVGIGLAALPIPIVIAAFLWIDRAEPEPRRYLFAAFVWGATIAVAIAIVLNRVSVAVTGEIAGYTFVPVVEESAKGLILLLLLWWRRHEFDGIIDGIVYAGLVAAGFTFTEEITYIFGAYSGGVPAELADAGVGSGGFAAIVFVSRAIGEFSHPLFTVMTGIGLGICATSNKRIVRILAPIGGLLTAIALHAVNNFSAAAGLFGIVYLVFFVPLFGVMIGFVTVARRRELALLELHLRAYVEAGWLHQWDLTVLSSFKARRMARRWAASGHGKQGKRAMTGLQHSATELALLCRRVGRRPMADFAVREHELLTAMAGHRQALASASPA